MNKAEIIKILKETVGDLDEILNWSQQSDGNTLNFKLLNGRPAFFCRTKEGKRVYLKQSDNQLIRELSSKYYDKKLRAAALKEKKQVSSCIAILEKDPEHSDVDIVSDKLPKAIKDNAVFSELTDEGYARRWQESNNVVKKRKTHRKDDYHKFKTLRGDYVGSKSEVIIADRLFVNGIPYHYEIAFTPEAMPDTSRPVFDAFGRMVGFEVIGNTADASDTLHPDFYVLNKRTRKAYFWEHLGKMDDPEYCRKNFNRFMRILDAGYVIGEDLLVTHEDSRDPLMTEAIDSIIEKYLK